MANPMFYRRPVALNRSEHKNKKITSEDRTFEFAAGTNSVLLAGKEFSEAGKEYPIVFAQAAKNIVPVALLGLRNEDNLYVDDSGRWDAHYIPAFVRRYPFVLAETGENDQRVVCIDEAYEGFNDLDGEPLFIGDEASPLLKQAMNFLEEYQKQYVRTEAFVHRLIENDLLMPLDAKVDVAGGQQFGLKEVLAVDEKRLLQLPDDQSLEFFRSGEMSWIYCHLISLSCIRRMIERMGARYRLEEATDEKGLKEEVKTQKEGS